ncbi:MAG: cobalamin biosynthesis protein CobD [Rhodoferax sp.]|nr:MAG: cobalamin biosynthesis protein CobD [Rhodoferax sp.]
MLPLHVAPLGGAVLGVAVLVALVVDHWLGEPPVRWHPVVWMGNFLGVAGRWLQARAVQDPSKRDWRAFWLGALVWIAGAATVCIAAAGLQSVLRGAPWWLAALGLGLLLKPLLAWALLRSEVLAVEAALAQSLDAGRERLRFLVSRDVSQLDATTVRESAIETLAENLNDSVVAPLFWFVLLGLPGAALFRFANTADAMWGYPGVYQGQNWAWAGKWAARVDDVLGWVPARITALLLMVVGTGQGLRQLRVEAARTPSPNSGWPMAAMALVLGVRLAKPGGYVLHAAGRAATAQDMHRALAFASNVVLALVFIALAASVLIATGGLL